jgi:hypothetical protein
MYSVRVETVHSTYTVPCTLYMDLRNSTSFSSVKEVERGKRLFLDLVQNRGEEYRMYGTVRRIHKVSET